MRIEELEQQNSTYVKLLEIAGIPPNSEPNTNWWQSNKPCSQLNPELLAMDSNGEIVILDSDEKSKELKCKKKKTTTTVKQEDKKLAPDNSVNEKKSAGSTISKTENTSHATSGPWNAVSGVPSAQQVISQSSMIIVSPPCLVPAPTPPSGEGSTHVGFSAQGVEKTSVTNMTFTTATLSSQATNIITVTNSCHMTDMSVSETGSSLSLHGSLIANTSTGSITAVTQALSGAPIMSTSQSSSNIHQQPTVMPQVPMLNLGGTMSLMQPMITINDQGIPVLHMVAGPAPMGNGQVIVNGSSGQNLLLMGNSTNSTGPTRIGTNMNASNVNQQALHITGSAGITPTGISLECQAGQSQGLIQTDAASIFQQTVCGGQLMGPTTQYLPNLHQIPPTSAPNQQVHMMAPSLASAQMISAQNNNVMIGPTIQGSQQSNTLLTVNSNTSTSTLPSALMLPNGQIIPVVREPSLLYQNSAPIGGSLLMATASTVPQPLIPNSQGCQTQTSVSTLPGRALLGNIGEINTESSSVSLPGVNLPNLQGIKDGSHSQIAVDSLAGSTSNGIKGASNRPLASATISVSSRTSSNSSICSLGERPLTAQSDVPNSQETTISTATISASTSSTPTVAGLRPSVKSKKAVRSNQRTIKPKPIVSQTASKVPKKFVSQASTHLNCTSAVKSNTECSTSVATPSVLTTSVTACSASSLLTLSDIEKLSQTSVASSVTGSAPTKDSSSINEKSVSKTQSDARPPNAITDILAQATESIFASSISDMSSSPNPNYYGSSNTSATNNNSHVDFLPNMTGDPESTSKITSEQSAFTPSMTLGTSEHDILPMAGAKNSEENNCNVVLNIVTESQTCSKQQQGHSVDILSDLVGEVYSTVSDEQPLIACPTSTTASTIVTPTTSSSTFETSLSVGKVNPKDITSIRPMESESCANEDNLGEILSNEVPSTSVLQNENTMCNLGLALSEDEESVSGCKTKRVCENDIQLSNKRSRTEITSNSINELESTLEGSETVAKTPVESCAEDSAQPSTSHTNSTEMSMSGSTPCNNSVSFVSISQLASSATSAITTPPSASLCTATFTNTMASTITSFTIDTAISNENSPLCSISPLLNSPNKSSDLAFTLGSTISEMPRVDESQFSTTETPNSTVSGASMNSALNSSTTNAPFMALSTSFGLATSLSSPTSSTSACSTASSAPSSSSSISSLGSTFCMSELTNLNSSNVSNGQQNFRSLSYPGVVNLQGPGFNGISNLHQGLGESTSPSGTVPHSLSGKNHKVHSLHYGSRQDELRPHLLSLQVADDDQHSHVSSQQNPTSTISSTHHSSGSLAASNELQFSTSPVAVQEGSSFCQAYTPPHPHHESQTHRTPVLNMNLPQADLNKAKSNQHRSHVSGGDPRHQNDIMSPPAMSHPHIQRSASNSVHAVGHNQENMISGIVPPPQRQNQGYPSVQRIHSMNRQSPQGAGGNTPSPKVVDLHGHSPVSSQRMTSSNSSTSPKPHLVMTQGQQLIRNHPVPSPGRNVLLTPPASSPGTFLPRRSPNVSTGDTPIIMSYSSENLGLHNTFRDLNFPSSQKQLPHQPISSGSATLTTNRATISYSAESLIQAQPSNHRPNCARESNSANSSARPDVNHHSGNTRAISDSNSLSFIQGGSSRPTSNDVQQQTFTYFTPFQQPLVDNLTHQPSMSASLPQAGNLKHTHAPSHTNLNKTCAMRGVSETSSQAIQSQPNFSFSLIQHQSVIGSGSADTQAQQPQHHHHHQQQQLSLHQGMVQDGNPGVVRHNNYISMGNYSSHNHGQQSAATGVSLQGPIHKDMQMPRPPPMPFMAPFHSNQPSGSQSSNIRHTTTNSFLPQNAGNGLNSMPTFHESYSSPINSLRTDNSTGVPPVGGNNSNSGGGNSNNNTNTVNNSTSSNVHSTDKGGGSGGGNTSYKSRTGGATKQDGTTSSKKSKQQSQHSKKKHQQYVEEEVNLSNSIFETGRSMTPYFTLPSLSPPRNEVPTYIPNPNPLFNPSQRGLTPNASQQPKTPDLGSPYTTPLFTPRTQSSLNLNFQAPGFGMNHLHSNGGMPNQIAPHGGGVNVTSHVPNFNLSNIFPDINNSNEGIGITPIKFHGNHILPPPQPGMDHNLQHHQSAGSLYHKRAHPPPVIHNGMTINSLLSHNPHGFDGRPQVPMGINNTMAPPFHGHSHTPSFSNVIPTLNFSMHDH